MRTSDLENDIKQLLASTKSQDDFGNTPRQISCRVNAVSYYQIGVLAEKVNMTRTGLAERLLEQAAAIAWEAAGLSELSDADIAAIKAPGKISEGRRMERSNSTNHDGMKFSRINCITAVFRHLGLEVGKAKDSGAVAVSKDNSTRICCLTSKGYETGKVAPDGERYWFTIYEKQLKGILHAKQAYAAFGCSSTDQIILIPAGIFSTWCGDLPPYTKGLTGWHVHLRKSSGKWDIRREGRGEPSIDVTGFAI